MNRRRLDTHMTHCQERGVYTSNIIWRELGHQPHHPPPPHNPAFPALSRPPAGLPRLPAPNLPRYLQFSALIFPFPTRPIGNAGQRVDHRSWALPRCQLADLQAWSERMSDGWPFGGCPGSLPARESVWTESAGRGAPCSRNRRVTGPGSLAHRATGGASMRRQPRLMVAWIAGVFAVSTGGLSLAPAAVAATPSRSALPTPSSFQPHMTAPMLLSSGGGGAVITCTEQTQDPHNSSHVGAQSTLSLQSAARLR